MKKSQVELQFNWIYVAVVGVAFLLLFISISSAVKKNAEAKLADKTVEYFDEIFTNLQASDKTEDSIMLPGMAIKIATDRDNCNFYTVEGTDLEGRSIEFTPLFSPDVITRKVLAFSHSWDMPFRAAYFLYLTSPEIAYVSIGQTPEMPENITHFNLAASASSTFTNKNYKKIRFVSSSGNPESFSLDGSVSVMDDKSVTAVFMQGYSIKFYEKEGNKFVYKGETQYINYPMLLAAIYSENKESYECNIEKSLKRLNKLAGITIKRTEKLKQISSCSASLYDSAISSLTQIELNTESYNINSLSVISSASNSLETVNKELNKKACQTIY
ncbi:MAG: hypothetical protein AABW92_02190 [Nanoarchaeota archaeon]